MIDHSNVLRMAEHVHIKCKSFLHYPIHSMSLLTMKTGRMQIIREQINTIMTAVG